MSDEQGPAIEVTVGDDHVATIEIRRPPNNFFSMDVIGGIADALAECDNNDAVRVAVLCAEGKHFCGGADFSPGGRPYTTEDLYAAAARIFDAETPSVAAVQGAAIGGAWAWPCRPTFASPLPRPGSVPTSPAWAFTKGSP